jgi:hypothetical protein
MALRLGRLPWIALVVILVVLLVVLLVVPLVVLLMVLQATNEGLGASSTRHLCN